MTHGLDPDDNFSRVVSVECGDAHASTAKELTASQNSQRGPRKYPWCATDTYIFIIAAILSLSTRLFNLTRATDSGTPVFDEKHYVPQAWDMVASFQDPITGGIESDPAYGLVVHPPLGKQLLALGEFIFGYSPLGWRCMTVLAGTLTILTIMFAARRLGGRTASVIAGFFAISDGVLATGSRFGMLDIFQVLFIVLAATCIICDAQQMHSRLHDAWERGLLVPGCSPRFGFRWWRFLAGVALGCALSVKWSGLYYMAFFGIMMVCMDYVLRRRYSTRSPWFSALLIDAPRAFLSLVILPFAVYIWSWRAWFSSETSIFRHALSGGELSSHSWLAKLPESLANWFYYHQQVMEFHASLTTSSGHVHPWDSKPWQWVVMGRPVLYHTTTNATCSLGFFHDPCTRMTYLFGSPALWWLMIPSLIVAIVALCWKKRGVYIVPVVAFLAGWVPWLVVYDRQMYFFYAEPLIPFTIIILALLCTDVWGRGPRIPSFSSWRRSHALTQKRTHALGTVLVSLYLIIVGIAWVYWAPIIYGIALPDAWIHSLLWLPSWR